jgi:hypothetical protein
MFAFYIANCALHGVVSGEEPPNSLSQPYTAADKDFMKDLFMDRRGAADAALAA